MVFLLASRHVAGYGFCREQTGGFIADAVFLLVQPTVVAEPGPVMLIVHITDVRQTSLDMLLYVAGAATLGAVSRLTPASIRLMMRAGALWNRWQGVRLSNGCNVVYPSDWHRQGIGTVALNFMIDRAQRYHPEADVRPIVLTRHHRKDIASDDPRPGFYRRFRLDWASEDQTADAPDWLSRPTVANLHAAPLPVRLRPIVPRNHRTL